MGAAVPIPTRYKGYYFRSQLEARWAVFFDHLGLDWEYGTRRRANPTPGHVIAPGQPWAWTAINGLPSTFEPGTRLTSRGSRDTQAENRALQARHQLIAAAYAALRVRLADERPRAGAKAELRRDTSRKTG